jgi:uncharacterized repeat protein (TIGR01451 family)
MDPPESLPVQVSEPATEAPRPAAAVALVWAHPAEVRVNLPAAYTLTVTNTGPEPVQQVVVQVRVPAGVTASDAKPPAKSVGGVLLWDLGTLAAGESKPLAMSFTSPTRGTLTADAWVTCTGTAATTVAVREPKLEAFIEAPATVELGQTFTVSYGVKNAGDCDLRGLRFVAAKPETLGSGEDHAGDIPELPVSRSWDGGSAQTALVPGVYTYEYAVTGADGLKATATAKVRVLAPKLGVSVTGPAELGIGKAAVYRATVANVGDATARGVRPTLNPAPALIRVEPDLPEVFDLKPGEKRTFAMIGDLTGAGVVTTKVTAAAANATPAAAECRTVVKGVPGIRMEVVDSADPLKVGEETTYEIKVTNTGTEADRNLVLSCDLPPGMTMVSADGPVAGLERIGVDFDLERPVKNRHTVTYHTVTFDPIRELGPKTEAVFKVKVRASNAGAAKFTASLASDHLTTPVVKEESTTVYGD